MQIILAGRGKMAKSIENECLDKKISCINFNISKKTKIISKNAVAIHVGSGREFKDLINFCEKSRIPVIQASTNVEYKINRDILIVKAPNLSIHMIKFISSFTSFAESISKNLNIKFIESHQSNKKDVSGTAIKISKNIRFNQRNIKSIRNEFSQIKLGIPKKNLKGHAYHEISFFNKNLEIKISTKILGREAYAQGAILLAKSLIKNRKILKNKEYQIEDVVALLKI